MDRYYQAGVVSIFAVIFSTLLLTVLTVGFIGLMITAQQRAVNNDLSQSAYDAALSGVEDAKRVVRACVGGSESACNALDAMPDCKVIARAGINGSLDASETVIASQTGNEEQEHFDQAYTCVNIHMNSPDYVYRAAADRAHVIPLRATGTFNQIVIEWYSSDDNRGRLAERPMSATDDKLLPRSSGWNPSAPPMLRAQIITPGQTFFLNSLDESPASHTVFLRPNSVSASTTNWDVSIAPDAPARATGGDQYTNGPTPIACSSNFANNGYSCRATFTLTDAITTEVGSNTLLRLNTIYKDATTRITLRNTNLPVEFNGVQPIADSTGRASNLFRRVEARLSVGSNFPYPSYAADVSTAICKDFSVDDARYSAGTCNP